ncbi:uncharacterized protein LOC106654152 [Trichogramma pretiosum]|uniref:uncharacterized protein LOC106654152 n=1 Tax=Trichogramma pretiosum TaxID=7493 RepID=UPI0006C9637D|nr:uncharacterized protein LOC106654152 [Trichogramma pretiosum]
MFASTCLDVPTRIDVVPMLIDEQQQPRKRNMSASSVESALLEPKKQKRLPEDQLCSRGDLQSAFLAAYTQSRPWFKSDYAPQQQQQQRDDRRSFNNCIRPIPPAYELTSCTPVEFIQHRDKRFKKSTAPYEHVTKRSNKSEDAWELPVDGIYRDNSMHLRGCEWWLTQ